MPLDKQQQEYKEFVELAAHDLDAPLRKLFLFFDQLTDRLKKNPEDDIQPYILRMQSCIAEMRSMIGGLTLLLEASSDTLEIRSCNIKTVIEEALYDLQQMLSGKKTAINLSSLPVLEGDSKQYRLLFKNILENAARFSRTETSLVLNIRSRPATEKEKKQFALADKPYHKIEISDNGIGFNSEYSEKIFQPFVRLHGKSQFPGNGLGLAICKKIVDNHNGVIYVQSDGNSGSCFILILPQTLN